MANIRHILQQLPEPQGKKETLVADQNVYDIVRHVMYMHNECQRDYDIISEQFWQGNDVETCRYIFNFCKKNIPYSIEPAKAQTVKSPAQILGDAIKGNVSQDCKHYALICNGIIHSLQRKGYPIKCKYRFCSDVAGEHYPKHVFCIVPTNDGDIWLDPVLPGFNQYHKYYYIKDKTPKMALYKVSGVGDQEPGNSYNDYISGFGGEVGAHGRGKQKIHNLWRDTKRGAARVSLAVPRNAFLELVKLNAFQLARIFYQGGQDAKMLERIKNKWVDLGGKWYALKDAINIGYNHYLKRRKRTNPAGYKNLSGFGYETSAPHIGDGGATAALISAAAAILAAFAEIIKEIKGKSKEDLNSPENYEPGPAMGPGPAMPPETQPGPQMGPGGQPGQYMDYYNTRPGSTIIPADRPEIPGASNALETTANVATDWGRGVKNFIENNRGTVITLGGLTLGVLAVKYIFSPTPKRK